MITTINIFRQEAAAFCACVHESHQIESRAVFGHGRGFRRHTWMGVASDVTHGWAGPLTSHLDVGRVGYPPQDAASCS